MLEIILRKMIEIPNAADEQNGSSISEDEAALYDRQIRLWGLDAQKRYARRIYNQNPCL